LGLLLAYLVRTPKVILLLELIEVSLHVVDFEFQLFWTIVDQKSTFFDSLAEKHLTKGNN
jgi:hypothetical protein